MMLNCNDVEKVLYFDHQSSFLVVSIRKNIENLPVLFIRTKVSVVWICLQ